MVQFSMRTLAMLTGLFGVVVAFAINILYSFIHVLGRVSGITNDRSHFFFGLLVVLIGFVGSLLVPFNPIVGACCWWWRQSRFSLLWAGGRSWLLLSC